MIVNCESKLIEKKIHHPVPEANCKEISFLCGK
jgi:hypothetical protein